MLPTTGDRVESEPTTPSRRSALDGSAPVGQDGDVSIPSASVEVPPRVLTLARGATLTPVWRNGLGGLTFRTDDGRYIKWGPLDDEANMRDEVERLRWARTWIAVPEVLEQGQDDAH